MPQDSGTSKFKAHEVGIQKGLAEYEAKHPTYLLPHGSILLFVYNKMVHRWTLSIKLALAL